jgi:hypothetical protein
VLDWDEKTIGFHQGVEDVLQNVLGVARVEHATADEVPQPGMLPLEHVGYAPVVVACHPLQARRVLHLLM